MPFPVAQLCGGECQLKAFLAVFKRLRLDVAVGDVADDAHQYRLPILIDLSLPIDFKPSHASIWPADPMAEAES